MRPWTNITDIVKTQNIAIGAIQEQLEFIANNSDRITDFDDQEFSVNDQSGNPLLTTPSDRSNPGLITVTQVSGEDNLFDVTAEVAWQQKGGRVMTRSLSTTIIQQ